MSWFSRKKSAQGGSSSGGKEDIKQQPAVAAPSVSHAVAADAYRAVMGPYVTEKAASGADRGSYVFRVTDNATKSQIKKAIQALYKVTVVSVRTIRLPSKMRRVGRIIGVKSGLKKAVVTLAKGDKIDIVG